MIAGMLILGGAVLTLLSAAGVLRFDDVLARMHALTKASMLGLVLVLLGAAGEIREPGAVTTLLLACVLQVLTLPVSTNLLARAVYYHRRAQGRPPDPMDELAAAIADGRVDSHE